MKHATAYTRAEPQAIRQLLERLLVAAQAIGVPERVVYELPVIKPLVPLAEVVRWSDHDLQRLVLAAYLTDLADQDRGGELPEDSNDQQQPSTGESS